MQYANLINQTSPTILSLRAKICDDFLSRFRGLMLTQELTPDNGIIIDEKSDSLINASIHMFFMNYPIAAIWVDSHNLVVDTVIAKPWHPYYAPKRAARYIVEAHPSRISDFKIGDTVTIQNV